jgi:hypothetical protein
LFVSALVTGAYWYVRNIVVVGNPLPSLTVHVGPVSLPTLKSSTPTSSVVHFLFDSRAWHGQMLPGLRLSLGPAWPALVALAFAGMIAAVSDRREPVVQMLGVVAALSFVAYLVTPQFLVALGRPIYFGVNVRYASPGLVMGLVLLPIALRRWVGWVTGGLAAVLLVTELDPTAWPTGFGWATFEARIGWGDALWAIALIGLAALVSLGAVAAWRRAGREPTRVRRQGARWAVLGAVALLVLLALTGVRGEYLRNRYVGFSLYSSLTQWTRGEHRQRILVAGLFMQGQFPLAGADLTNSVQVAGVRIKGGGYRPARTCAEWVHMLEQGHYDVAVLLPAEHLVEWTETQPDARLVLRSHLGANPPSPYLYSVYRLDRSRTGRHC